MDGCDVFSLPSWQEGFGIVYLEAMALGKPVIGCKGEGIEDFVVDGETGLLVEPKNPDQLADAMEFLICNPEKARTMGENARQFVLQNYTWEKNAEKMIDIYRNVTHGT
jgi:glycosyltransferase involved in cell wall biosynthesis